MKCMKYNFIYCHSGVNKEYDATTFYVIFNGVNKIT